MTTTDGILVIGDVHGKVDKYWKILRKNLSMKSIQVGDFGLREHHEWHLKNMESKQHKINFGNHDDYSFLESEHSLGDFSIDINEIMTVRGALSIDKYKRIEGVDWWSNEELNYNEMQQAIDTFIYNKPKVMITHDCPLMVQSALFGITDKSITNNGLQAMFEEHQPDIWIFGHHHKSRTESIEGTKFICLAELETYIL